MYYNLCLCQAEDGIRDLVRSRGLGDVDKRQVKKIIVEHGGSIAAESAPLGGARVRVMLPVAGTPAAQALLEAREWQGPPSSARPKSERVPGSK